MEKYPKLPHHKSENGFYKIPAAWLIEKIGFKDKSFGDVGVYIHQPLVIVNNGNASGSDILKLSQKADDKDDYSGLLIHIAFNRFKKNNTD